MPEQRTKTRAAKAKRTGKKPSTQSRKQAIAIGLSKARRSGVKVKPPKKGQAKASTRRKAQRDYARGRRKAA